MLTKEKINKIITSDYGYTMLNRTIKIKWLNCGEWISSFEGTLLEYMIKHNFKLKKFYHNGEYQSHAVIVESTYGTLKISQNTNVSEVHRIVRKFIEYHMIYLGDKYKIVD